MNAQNDQISLLQQLEVIANALKNSDLKFESSKEVEACISRVQGFLGVDRMQTILFATVFIISFTENSVEISDMAEYVGTSNFKVTALLPQMEVLISKRLLQQYSPNHHVFSRVKMTMHDISFSISKRVLDAILKENQEDLYVNLNMDMASLLEYAYDRIQDRDDGDLTFDELVVEIKILIEKNMKLSFVQRLKNLDLSDDDRLLLLYVCREAINGEEDVDVSRTMEKIYSDPRIRFKMRHQLMHGINKMIQHNILEIKDAHFRSDRNLGLTNHGIEILFAEDMKIIKKATQHSGIKRHQDLKQQKLHFESVLQQQLNELTNILSDENYDAAICNLRKSGLSEGMAVLFHGPPGTGKTATVYQLARATGRDLMEVDISDTKSMWFGESEKRIKGIFNDYRDIVESGNKAPILLFNECDAVFGTRRKVGSSSVDQTENAIQNIILQSIEELKGILIGTTNLTVNLDKAFQRRFLWKIHFDVPGLEARKYIWRSKLPFLSEKDANELANRYLLSGGNIDNIARKTLMYEILHGIKPDLEAIMAYCREEDSLSKERSSIGF